MDRQLSEPRDLEVVADLGHLLACEDQLIQEAEKTVWELEQLQTPEASVAFSRRLEELLKEIRVARENLEKRSHSIAFVGAIGVGKSTAICRVTGLEVGGDSNPPNPALATGAGNTTVCEVCICEGKQFGLSIVAFDESATRLVVEDWSDQFFLSEEAQGAPGSEFSYTSKEIDRAVRNMAGLARQKGVAEDPAEALARAAKDQGTFVDDLIKRMEMDYRTRDSIWFDSTKEDCQPLEWVKKTFKAINNGNHSEFGLPKRINLFVPNSLLSVDGISLNLVDTKGLDKVPARPDIEAHWNDPHTQVVLCSSFNDAPSLGLQLLLEHSKALGAKDMDQKASLLVFPRVGDALGVNYDNGDQVETEEDGYHQKGLEVNRILGPISGQLNKHFFNKVNDDPEKVRHFLKNQIFIGRNRLHARLRDVVENAQMLLRNRVQEHRQSVIKEVASFLQTAILNFNRPTPWPENAESRLLVAIREAYAATVRASIRREGEWPKLDFTFHLGAGARMMVVARHQANVDAFSVICQNLALQEPYVLGKDLVLQAERVLREAYETLLRQLQDEGKNAYGTALHEAKDFWNECNAQWGAGSGYINRIIERNRLWFENGRAREIERHLQETLEQGWEEALKRVQELFEP